MATKSLLHSSLLDNQYYNSMLVGNAPPDFSTVEDILLESILDSSQSTFVFNNLANYDTTGYKHLQIRMSVKAVEGGATSMYFNNDSNNAMYSSHRLYGFQGSANGTNLANLKIYVGAKSNLNFSPFIIDILSPFNTNHYTTARITGSNVRNVDTYLGQHSGVYLSTDKLTSITFTSENGFVANSRFTLIGLK